MHSASLYLGTGTVIPASVVSGESVSCIVGAIASGGGAVGQAVGAVGGRVVGGTGASTSGHSSWGYYSNEQHHGGHNNNDVEADTEAGIAPLRSSSGLQGRDGQDECRDGEREVDDRRTTYDQGADGEHEGAYCNSDVVLLRQRQANGGCCRRLRRYQCGSFGELRLVVVRKLGNAVVGRGRSLFDRWVDWRKVCLGWIALWEIVFDRRQRIVRRGALALERVAIFTNNRLVFGLFLRLVEVA